MYLHHPYNSPTRVVHTGADIEACRILTDTWVGTLFAM